MNFRKLLGITVFLLVAYGGLLYAHPSARTLYSHQLLGQRIGLYGILREPTEAGQIVDQSLKRRAQLIFRFPESGDVVELRFCLCAIASDGGLKCQCRALEVLAASFDRLTACFSQG